MLKSIRGFESWSDTLYSAYRTRIITPIVRKAIRMWFYNPIKAEVVNSKGEVTQVTYTHNDIVDEGMNSLLDIFFRNQTQIPIWYMGLIDGAGSQSLNNTDKAGMHAGWVENTSFTGGPSRKNWTTVLAAAAARSISNSTTLDFAFTTTQTIHGIFVINHVTADTATETLWATAPFSTEVTVNNGDTLKITYTVSG